MPRETSAAIGELFRGFSGYVQADAKSVYDLLFKPAAERPPLDDGEPDLDERHEVGCWSHCRRKAWEVAITSKDPVAREAVLRIKRIFDLDRSWRGKPPDEIRSLRELHLRPHTDAFFAWVAVEYERVKDQRGMLRSALGYAHRQRGPLTRFFDDGRLALTNNAIPSGRAIPRSRFSSLTCSLHTTDAIDARRGSCGGSPAGVPNADSRRARRPARRPCSRSFRVPR